MVSPDPHVSNLKEKSSETEILEEKKSNNNRSRRLWAFTLLLLLIGLSWFLYWYFYLQYYESTDDAYANGNMINLNPVISGAVVAFFADDTDLVKEGQLLVLLDQTNYQIIYQKELATLAQIVLQVRQLYDEVEINKALVQNKKQILEREKFDYERRLDLRKNNPLAQSVEDFYHSSHNYMAALYDFQQSEARLDAAVSAAGNSAPAEHPLVLQQKNNVRTAFYNLQHCSIYAPATGYVAQRAVDVGMWITPSTNLMAIIPTDYVWVDANFKETQLKKMRIGQPAEVTFDLYGSHVKYKGQVLGIASGSGSVFSLIPPQNATGNWIKIVQRLAVRISLDPEVVKDYPVRLGISALVDVDITNQDLPYLATTPSEGAVGKTKVFDIDLQKVNQIMDEIIQTNLEKSLQEKSLQEKSSQEKSSQESGESNGANV